MQGGECFGFFLQSGLDKAVLRDIWTLVAGTEGRLSQQQFVASVYLQDLARRGAQLPKQLPPGRPVGVPFAVAIAIANNHDSAPAPTSLPPLRCRR